MLGGTIQVESEVGRGTEFTVMLECEISEMTVKEEPDPEQREPLKNEKQKIRAEIQRRYEGKKVLLVEDNELNREIATAIMEEIGLNVDCVEDGTDAVNIMSSAEGRSYDLIFMDKDGRIYCNKGNTYVEGSEMCKYTDCCNDCKRF